jgi:hypothetical protein
MEPLIEGEEWFISRFRKRRFIDSSSSHILLEETILSGFVLGDRGSIFMFLRLM